MCIIDSGEDNQFQSSPAPKSRCYLASRADKRRLRPGFNPHRLRRAGATVNFHREHDEETDSIIPESIAARHCVRSANSANLREPLGKRIRTQGSRQGRDYGLHGMSLSGTAAKPETGILYLSS